MGAPGVRSVDTGRPSRESSIARMAALPEIERCEGYLQGFAYWTQKNGQSDLCMVIGSRLGEDSLGALKQLKPHHRQLLTEPGTIIIDRSDKKTLGVEKIGDTAEVAGVRVRVVDFVDEVKSLAAPYVFCSITTARPMLRLLPDQITFVLGKCRNPEDAHKVVKKLGELYGEREKSKLPGFLSFLAPRKENDQEKVRYTVFTKDDFSLTSRMHWLMKTKAGIALGYAAALGLLVGAVVTSQTLYAATAASLKEFAVLRALGIPRWRMSLMVVIQSLWIGLIGIGLAIPAAYGLKFLAARLAVQINLPPMLDAITAAITLLMALGSGLLALRSLRDVEPASLLR